MLYSDISALIFEMIQSFYDEMAGREIATGMVFPYQTGGDFDRCNPHWHGLLFEGGFNKQGEFVYLPISNTKQMTEFFRHLVIKHFVDKKLLNDYFIHSLLSWKNSGFSIDNSESIAANDDKAREALAQYIAQCPISLDFMHRVHVEYSSVLLIL